MDDEISVTVIATGFETRGSYFPISAPQVNLPKPEKSYNINSTFSYPPKQEHEEPPKPPKEENDNFYDIMSLFRNK